MFNNYLLNELEPVPVADRDPMWNFFFCIPRSKTAQIFGTSGAVGRPAFSLVGNETFAVTITF